MTTQDLTVTVTAEMAAELQRRAAAGGYASTGAIVHEALADWLAHHDEGEDIAALREAIRIGEESGPGLPADEVFDRLLDVIDEYRRP